MTDLVEAETFYAYPAAEIARGRLAAEGIGSVVFDGAMSAYTGGGLIPARLMVLAEDRVRARAVLAEEADPAGPPRLPSGSWDRAT